MTKVAIIGAGMAGLACARKLADAGCTPVVFDKGRGIGGRIATKRVDELRFDHGAQYVTAKGEDFAAVLREMQTMGSAKIWNDGAHHPHFVGTPGMSGMTRALATGLDVRQNALVTAVTPDADGWLVHIGAEAHNFERVVITVPAPQIAGLLGQEHPITEQSSHAHLAPCLTLMAAINAPAPFVSRRNEDDPLAWIAQDSSKPERPKDHPVCWVAQAGEKFSTQYLEDDQDAVTARMLPLLCDRLNVAETDVVHARSHRWRYARVTRPLGQAFLRHQDTLYAGGDWCLGPRVEAAWSSGNAIAEDILSAIAR